MTLDHRVPTATKGHFHSILVSNIFSNPLFLLSARCRGKAVYGLWHFNQISDLSFVFSHAKLYSHVTRNPLGASDSFRSAFASHLSPMLTFSSARTSFTASL